MRKGLNPNRDQPITNLEMLHQVVIPVYIPSLNGYYEKSLQVLKLCLLSLFNSCHKKTYITIVNNGSCDEVTQYLNQLYQNESIHEIIHTTNIGKVNALIKGLAGHATELVTLADADVLFLPNWQKETVNVFEKIPLTGAVGLTPQFCSFKNKCENVLFKNLFNHDIKFSPVKNPKTLIHFYDSIGWQRDYNPDYLKYILTISTTDNFKAVIGSGHFVTTYKRAVFDEIKTFIPFKLGGISESYLDALPLKYDYWRLTTYENNAYHIGNQPEQWMYELFENEKAEDYTETRSRFYQHKKKGEKYLWRNKIFNKLFKMKFFREFLYEKWGLPKDSLNNY